MSEIKVNESQEHAGETSETLRAAEADGQACVAGRKLLSVVERLIAPIANRYETKPEHWIHGWDEGLSFCFECAEKKVAELLTQEPDGDYSVDGGWASEGDSQAFCETCQCALDNSFTTYAAEQEMDHFDEFGFDPSSPHDCHAFAEVIAAVGCGNPDINRRIERMAATILTQIQATKSNEAKRSEPQP
jgi:hypothetical protein